MDFEMLLKRQAVLAWRDMLVLSIWRVVNRAGIKAKLGVEAHLSQAGLVDTLWDPASFTRDRIDGEMRTAVLGELESLLRVAAKELRAIDHNYGALADALLESLESLRLPMIESSADLAPGDSSARLESSGRLATAMAALSRQELVKSAREWGTWALDLVGEASEAASQKLQSGTGLHDRLRRYAQARIDAAWMASVGDPPPLMAQLLSVVETVASEARSMAR